MTGRRPYDGLEVVESESWGWSWPAEGTGARDPLILEGQNPPGAIRPAKRQAMQCPQSHAVFLSPGPGPTRSPGGSVLL
jgi:hypothetical protein